MSAYLYILPSIGLFGSIGLVGMFSGGETSIIEARGLGFIQEQSQCWPRN